MTLDPNSIGHSADHGAGAYGTPAPPTKPFVDKRFGPGAVGERNSTSSDPAVAYTSRHDPEPALQKLELGAIAEAKRSGQSQSAVSQPRAKRAAEIADYKRRGGRLP